MIRMMWTLMPAIMLAGCAGTTNKDIAKAFDTDDPDLRREGVVLLADRKGGLDGEFLKAYALLAEDPAPLVRATAVTALGRAGDPAYLDVVIEAMNDKDLRVRLDAAEALDGVHGDAAVAPLSIAARNEADDEMRARCVTALRHYKTRAVLETLLEAIDDHEYGVRLAARNALRELTGEDCGYQIGRWRASLAAKDDPFAVATVPTKPWWKW